MIDSHCHLDARQFAEDRDAVFSRAFEVLSHVVLIGMCPSTLDDILALTERYPDRTCATAGTHPHEADQWNPETRARVLAALDHPQVRALGECGLDWFKNYHPRDVQIPAFREQLEIAVDRDIPFVLHCRDAFDDCFAGIREVYGDKAKPLDPVAVAEGSQRPIGIAHCFSGNEEQAATFVELGMLVSFAGQLTYKSAKDLQAAARSLDTRLCLVETDAPYLAPVPHRGKRNESAFVTHTAEKLAELQGKPVEEIDRATSATAAKLFGLTLPASQG